MSCEITLFQKNNIPLNNLEIIDPSKEIINSVIDNCLDDNSHFVFYKTKN